MNKYFNKAHFSLSEYILMLIMRLVVFEKFEFKVEILFDLIEKNARNTCF